MRLQCCKDTKYGDFYDRIPVKNIELMLYTVLKTGQNLIIIHLFVATTQEYTHNSHSKASL